MFDRSMFLDELKRNPSLITRLNTIVNGEIGHNAPLDMRVLYLETIFNRAQARGQSLAEVTRSVDGRYNADRSGRGGYYPTTTFVNGAPRSLNEQNRFNEQVLKPVLGGSDVSTQKLGFAATGNASEGTNNFASRRLASGIYSRGKWLNTGSGNEMFVQERGDNIDRLNRYVSGGTIPRPPADIPMTDAAYFQRGQGPKPAGESDAAYITRSLQHYYPGYQPPQQASLEGGGTVPLPAARPSSIASTAPAAAPAPGNVFETGAAPMNPLTGMRTPGTIDLANRPVVKNPDGSISTVRSASVGVDGHDVLLPTVTPQGTIETVPQAVDRYRSSGENLGTFYSPEAASNFAQTVHAAQAEKFAPPPGVNPPPSAQPSPQNRINPGPARSTPTAAAAADALYSYIDPNTRHRIVNPSGSGESAMGLTRDIGPAPSRQTPLARPAPAAPQRPAAAPPPAQTAAPPPAAQPVPLPRPRPSLSPFGNLTTDEMQRRPITPPVPGVFDVKQPGGPMAGLVGGSNALMLDPNVTPLESDLAPKPLTQNSGAQIMAGDPFAAPFMTNTPTAPPEAGLLASPSPEPSPRQRPTQNLAPWPTPAGGSEVPAQAMPLFPPTTVNQQLTGQSPFSPTPQPQGEFASTTLLPFQWPWEFAGDWGGWG